jgi:sugar fermentation stimulation protein A
VKGLFKVESAFTATFLDRPNRFLIRCDAGRRGRITAFMPNPGRLWELLLPGVMLYLADEARKTAPRRPVRKTRYTVVAVERDGAPVFLHTHRNNAVARRLIERRAIGALKNAEIVRAEAPMGRSRFDFLLRERNRDLYLEVKSCTLFGNGVAMFPDAITDRGRRHLLELAELSKRGTSAAVLFLVHAPQVHWFMPDYHTDLAFSRTLLAVRDRVRVLPVALNWSGDLQLREEVRLLRVPWRHIDREARDGGSYLLIMRLNSRRRIDIGGLGSCLFQPGHYVYVGSATRNLDARVARHLRTRKRKRWHIDHFREFAVACAALPIRSSTREEHTIAEALADIFEPGPEGFGASDSPCPTHLFQAPADPLALPSFHKVLQRFRMKQPLQPTGEGRAGRR